MYCSFHENGIDVTVVSANQLTHEAIEGSDMVFSAGGDGTFLKAASFVNTPIPVAGINTDPARSEGNLCCYKVDNVCNRFNYALDRLLTGNFQWRLRNRIRVGMVNQDGFWYELPRYALNEVFIAESDASRPSHYNIGIDQHQRESQRSSGIIVCTGTGSSAWHYSAVSFCYRIVDHFDGKCVSNNYCFAMTTVTNLQRAGCEGAGDDEPHAHE